MIKNLRSLAGRISRVLAGTPRKPLPTPRRFDPLRHRAVEADKVSLSQFVIERLVPLVGVSPYPIDEQMLMCVAMAYFRPSIVVEWGTHIGASARIFHECRTYLGLDCAIHSIDLPPGTVHPENLDQSSDRARLVRGLPVHLHEGDGVGVAAGLAPFRGTVLFFVDGDHEEATVRRELAAVWDLADDVVVLAHDTFFQVSSAGYNVGPANAVREFCESRGLDPIESVPGLPGMTLIASNRSRAAAALQG